MPRNLPAGRHASAPLIDKTLQIWPGGWTASLAVMVGAAVYMLAHMLVRLPFSDVIAVDWVGETVYAQTLDWGQTPKYPPLPAWALWLVHQVTGPGVLSTLVVKYAVLWAAFVAYFSASRRVLAHDGWAVLATLSLLLLFQVAWNAHEGVTHTIFLTLAAPLTLLAILRARDAKTSGEGVAAYALVGLAVAIGALSKQAYFAGLAALVLAMLLQPGYRRVLLSCQILISGVVAAALAGPHYVWALTSGFDFGGAASATLARPGLDSVTAQVLSGLWSSIRAPLLFLSPLVPLALLLMPRAFAPRNLAHPGTHGVAGADPVRLVRDTLLFGVAVLIVPVLVAGVAHYGERWMHPLMLLGPIYLVAMIRAVRPTTWQVRAFIWIMFALTLIALGWRLAGFVAPSPVTCGKCRLEVPYSDLADSVKDLGFADGTLLAGDEHIAGNMRTYFPHVRVVALNYGYYDPPQRETDLADAGQCLVVWRTRQSAATTVIPPAALSYAGLIGLPEEASVEAYSLPHAHGSGDGANEVSHFAAMLMPGVGRCR
ncbi:MAG: glycosyltransferase family 39 protein [Candidatus Phaeomarinobacter sp.]